MVFGFHTEGGEGGEAGFPPPRNLEIEYGYYISYLHVTECKYVSSKYCVEKFVPDCVRSNLRGCKFKIFLVGGGEDMPPDPP